jgi:hypothetical protein
MITKIDLNVLMNVNKDRKMEEVLYIHDLLPSHLLVQHIQLIDV